MRTPKLVLASLVLPVILGCSRSADRALDRIDPVGSGDACPNGGNVVRYGIDRNHDGTLEDDEVTAVQYVCNPAPPANAPLLQRSDPEAADATCAAGGTRVSVGPDTNGNGQLDDAEIVQSTAVCATPPPPVLVRTRPADSATCAAGGTIVESGVDRNGDGKLEDDEVQRNAHVCNSPDKPALVRLDPEPKGAHCAYGGTAVRSGLDANGDGMLQDAEVTSTSYACDAPPVVTTLYGDHVIRAQADVDAFKGIQRLAGALSIDQCTLASVSLPELQTIEGRLAITNNASLTSVAFDNIVTPLRGIDIEGNALITDVRIASWQLAPSVTVTGDVTISNNAALTSAMSTMPITQLDGTLRVENNAKLTLLQSRDELARIGGSVIIRKNPALVVAVMPYVLQIGGDLDIEDNDALYNLMGWDSGWRLRSIGGSLTIAGGAKLFEVRGLDLVKDVVGDVLVARTPALDNLVNLGGLRHVGGSVTIRDNVQLGTLVGFESLTSIDGSFVVTGNANIRQFFNAYQLASIGGDIRIEKNPALLSGGLGADFTPPVFGNLGSLYLVGNAALQDAYYPNLTRGSVYVLDNPALTTLSLPAFAGAGTIEIANDAALPTVAAPQLTMAGWVMVHDNAALASLSLPKLTRVDTIFQVRNNAKLPECAVDAIAGAITTHPSVETTGNDTHATCQ